jgi:ribosomal protein S18 acetylase RimI-like enzyme
MPTDTTIENWSLDRAPELADCYAAHTSWLGHANPLTPDLFADGITAELNYLFGRRTPLIDEQFFVAIQPDRITGFIHVGIVDGEPTGIIRYLGFQPDDPDTGSALLDEAEAFFAERSVSQVSAFKKGRIYAFTSVDGGLCDRAEHIHELVKSRGYALDYDTLTMTLDSIPDFEPDHPDDTAKANMHATEPTHEKPRVCLVMNTANDEEIGMCLSYSLSDAQPVEDLRPMLYINWLVSNKGYRRQGWGQYMLLETLREAKARGYTSCVLGTDLNNQPARTLYEKHGFTNTYCSPCYKK